MNEEEKPRLRFAHVGIEPPVEQGEQPVSLIAVHRSACQRDDCEIPKSFWNPRGVQYRSARYVFLVARCGWGVPVFDSVGRYTAGLFGEFLGEALVPTNVARRSPVLGPIAETSRTCTRARDGHQVATVPRTSHHSPSTQMSSFCLHVGSRRRDSEPLDMRCDVPGKPVDRKA